MAKINAGDEGRRSLTRKTREKLMSKMEEAIESPSSYEEEGEAQPPTEPHPDELEKSSAPSDKIASAASAAEKAIEVAAKALEEAEKLENSAVGKGIASALKVIGKEEEAKTASGVLKIFSSTVGAALKISHAEIVAARVGPEGRKSWKYVKACLHSISRIWDAFKDFKKQADEKYPLFKKVEKAADRYLAPLKLAFAAFDILVSFCKKDKDVPDDVKDLAEQCASKSMPGLSSAGKALESLTSGDSKVANVEDITKLGLSTESIAKLSKATESLNDKGDKQKTTTFIEKTAAIADTLPKTPEEIEVLVPLKDSGNEKGVIECRKALLATIGNDVSSVERIKLTALALSKYAEKIQDKDKIPKGMTDLATKIDDLGKDSKTLPKKLADVLGAGASFRAGVEKMTKLTPKAASAER